MSDKANTGISGSTALFLLFLGLKLANVITWSWWWVFSPLWIPLTIVIVIFFLMVIFNFFR